MTARPTAPRPSAAARQPLAPLSPLQERIELAEEEAARSRAETDAARLEIDRLSAELATALQRAQAKRKTSAAVAAQARDAIGAECEERVREERARGAQEAALLREAAATDLASARAQHAAEMAAVAAERQVGTYPEPYP